MPPARQRCNRRRVWWYVLGIVAVQIGIGIAVERSGVAVRDPDYRAQTGLLRQRLAESPDRPLLLALGSSRTLMGFDAGLVSRADPSVVAFNFSALGAGPMLEQIHLRRLLADGVRPQLVLVEVAPLQLATQDVIPSEESVLNVGRLSWSELRSAAKYYRFPATAYCRWLGARCLATVSRHQELHDALHIDAPRGGLSTSRGLDAHGTHLVPIPAADKRAANLRETLERFGPRLGRSHLAAGPAQALRDLIDLCRSEHLPVALIMMPECSGFRALYSPTFHDELAQLLTVLRSGGDIELFDAREWVPDDGFWDGHHLDADGARLFTERFLRDVLPQLRRQFTPQSDTPPAYSFHVSRSGAS